MGEDGGIVDTFEASTLTIKILLPEIASLIHMATGVSSQCHAYTQDPNC